MDGLPEWVTSPQTGAFYGAILPGGDHFCAGDCRSPVDRCQFRDLFCGFEPEVVVELRIPSWLSNEEVRVILFSFAFGSCV